ncbi:MAG TPA: glycosyltransferase family 39 protein [Chthonomonadaceae bacterium]|nr:glycosyltransferase family 39 protein [Chthonomonadaceae bacterium]
MSTTMATPTTAGKTVSSSRDHNALWCGIGLAVVALLGLPALLYPFCVDQGMFAYIADVWLRGGLPYRDAWDIKPPGIFAIYALAQLFFGRGMVAAHIADLLATLIAAGGLYALARRQFSAPAAAFAPILFGIAYYTQFLFCDVAQTEGFAAPLAVWTVYAILRWRENGRYSWPMLAGACLGGLALLKTPFVLIGLLAVAPLMASRRRHQDARRWNNLGLFLMSAAVPLLLTVVYFAVQGALGQLTFLLAAQKAYGSRTMGSPLYFLHVMPARFLDFCSRHSFVVVLGALAAVPNAVMVRRKVSYWPDQPLLYGWLGLNALIILMQWRLFEYHFLVLLPPLALLAAGTLGGLQQALARRPERLVRVCGLAFALLMAGLPVARDVARFRVAWLKQTGQISQQAYWSLFAVPNFYPFSNTAAVADYVRARTGPQDTILLFEFDPSIYYLADRYAPTRHLSAAPLYKDECYPDAMRQNWIREQVADVARRPPRLLIVVGAPRQFGLTSSPEVQPARIHLAGYEYAYSTQFTRDRIYRLISPAHVAARKDAGAKPGVSMRR